MDMNKGFCLRWDRFADIFKGNFSHLLKNENFTDVSLYCEGQLLNCHRVILSASSAYFRNLLLEVRQSNPVLILKDIRVEDLKCLLSFIYTGEVTVLQDQLSRVVKLGEALKVKGLGEDDEDSNGDVLDEVTFVESEPKRRKVASRPEQTANQSKNVNSRVLPQTTPAESLSSSLASVDVEFENRDSVNAAQHSPEILSATSLKHEEREEEDTNANETFLGDATNYNDNYEDSSEQPESEKPAFNSGQDGLGPSGSIEVSADGMHGSSVGSRIPVDVLVSHQSEANSLSCVFCLKEYRNKCNLADHYIVHHSESVIFSRKKCELCEKDFKTNNALSIHKTRTHGGGRVKDGSPSKMFVVGGCALKADRIERDPEVENLLQ